MASSFDFANFEGSGIPNLYELLGVDINATEGEIRKSYLAKARLMHPDKNPGIQKSDEMMKYLNKAREVLFDPENRIKYDEYLADDDSTSKQAKDLINLPGGTRLSDSVIQLLLWETEAHNEKFCNLSQDLQKKLNELTTVYSSGYKPFPQKSRYVRPVYETSPLQSLMDESAKQVCISKRKEKPMPQNTSIFSYFFSKAKTPVDTLKTDLDIDWLDLAYKSITDRESLNCDACYVYETLTELLTRMHISTAAVKFPVERGKVAVIDFSGASLADLNFLMQLFMGCSREEAGQYSFDDALQHLMAFIPVVNTQTSKVTQPTQAKCTSCKRICSNCCANCTSPFCANCIFKKRLFRLNMPSLQNTCKSCIESICKQDGELWKEQSLKFICSGDQSSLVVAHGCMLMALCAGVHSTELLYDVGKRLLQQNYYESSLEFLTSFLLSCTDSKSVKAYMLIASALEKLSERPHMDYIGKLSCLMAANDVYAITQKITEGSTSSISVPHLARNAELLYKKLHTLYSDEKERCAAETTSQLDIAWASRNFYKMISILTTTLDNKFGSHFDDYAMIGLEVFLSTKNIKLMRNEDNAAMQFFQGVLKFYKGEQAGYIDIEQAVLKGYHSEWMRKAAIDVVMTKLLYNLGSTMPHEELHTALKELNVDDLLSKDSKCLAALKVHCSDLLPPCTRQWPELCVTGINSRATLKYEQAAIRMYQENKWRARDVALAYIDFIPSHEHPSEICICFLLAGLWFFKDLEATAKKLKIYQAQRTPIPEIYAIKRAVFLCVGLAFCSSQEHFHPGMQLYVSRVGLQIILGAKNYAEAYFTSQNSDFLSQVVKVVFQTCRFCPFWNMPIVMACEAPLLHIITGQLHGTFTLSLQYVKPMKCIPFTEPELKYQLYENSLRHLCSLEEPDIVHSQAMESLLAERGWSVQDVSFLMTSPLSPRSRDGWLIQQPKLGVTMEYASLEGFVLDLEAPTGPTLNILAVPADSRNVGLISKNDIWEFLQLPPGALVFSLDPPNEDQRFHPFQAFRYEPKELKGSTLLHTMFEADYLLKSFSVGTEVSAVPPFKQRPCIEGLIANLPKHLQKVLKPMSERGQSWSHMQRFWIQADELIYDESERNGKLIIKMKNPNMVIRTHPLMTDVDGKLKDTSENVNPNSPEYKFAADLSTNYEEIGKYFPIFARLREIFKLLFLHNVIQNTLEDYRDKAEGKGLTIPQSVIERIQKRQREDKLRKINEMLTKVKGQFDSCCSARYSGTSDARARIISSLMEICRGFGSRYTMETKVDNWLNNNYHAEGELTNYICGCVRNATQSDISALRDAAYQAGYYGSSVDDMVRGIQQKHREQVSSVLSTLKSQYCQIVSGYNSQISNAKPQITRDLTDMCKGNYSTMERLVQNWLDSYSGPSELSNYICNCLPSLSGDDIKRIMRDEVKTKYRHFSTFVSNLKGGDVLPKPTSTCNWVPAALLQKEGNDSYCMCYGGVIICPKPIRKPVNINPRSISYPVPPRPKGNKYRNHYNPNQPTMKAKPNSNPRVPFVSTATNSSGMVQFTFGTIFKGSQRNGAQVTRIYLQDNLATKLHWGTTQNRVSIQHPTQLQKPLRPQNNAVTQAGGTILNSRNTQSQARRLPNNTRNSSNYNQGNTIGHRNSGGQGNSGNQGSSGGYGNSGRQRHYRFSAAGGAAGFMAGFTVSGGNGSGGKSGGSGSGGGGGGDSSDDEDDQKRVPWKPGTWNTDKGGSTMLTQITGHFQHKDKNFVEILINGKKAWVSLHKSGRKCEVWRKVGMALELEYYFDFKGKHDPPPNKKLITGIDFELRIRSGWYGRQPEGRIRLDRKIAKNTLAEKAQCSLSDIEGPGIYIFVHKSTNRAYVGQSKAIGNRLLQHVTTATSGKDAPGKFGNFLRDNINIDEWEVTIRPCAKEHLDKLEFEEWTRLQKDHDLLNVKSPPRPK